MSLAAGHLYAFARAASSKFSQNLLDRHEFFSTVQTILDACAEGAREGDC